MTFEIDRELLDVALGLGPLIKEHSPEGESNRRVSAAVIQAMKDAGLVRMMTPKSVGGLELDPITSARVFEEVARFDSAASWILQAANSGDFYCARLPDQGGRGDLCQRAGHDNDSMRSSSNAGNPGRWWLSRLGAKSSR